MSSSSNFTKNVSGMDPKTFQNLYFIFSTYVLLPQIIFGVGGNLLNLFVLLNRKMRSKTNMIFAAMSLSDLLFLILQLHPFFFATGLFKTRQFVRDNNLNYRFLSNCLSTISIWLMTYATLERVQVVRCPFRVTEHVVTTRFMFNLFLLILTAIGLTSFHIIEEYTPFVRIATYLNAGFVIYGPLAICSFCNFHLVKTLRSNNRCWDSMEESQAHTLSTQKSRAQIERKVTVVVSSIISCFVFFNVPGAVIYMIKEFFDKNDLRIVCAKGASNVLTTSGKVLNFILFFMTSGHFRKMLKQRCCSITETRRSSWKSQKTTTLAIEMDQRLH